MTESRPTFEMALDQWIARAGVSFSYADAADALKAYDPEATQARLIRQIKTTLDEDGSVFEKKDEPETAWLRSAFFDRKTFELELHPEEADGRFLLPGGRFAPFCHNCIFPSEITLLDEDETPLATQTVKMSIDRAAGYYCLLGAEEMFHTFEADHLDNPAVLALADATREIRLTAYCLPEKWKKHTAFQVTVQSWSEGIFALRPIPLVASEKPDWIPAFEQALCTVFENDGERLEIPEQIARALWLNPDILSDKVPFDAEKILRCSSLIEIVLEGSRTFLWRNDEDRSASDEADEDALDGGEIPDGVSISSGKVDSLESILADLECPVTQIEIVAMMKDECWRGTMIVDHVTERLEHLWPLPFADDAQRAYFQNYIDLMFEEIAEDYNRVADHDAGRVRTLALKINAERLRFLHRIRDVDEATFSEEAQEAFEQLAKCSALLLKVLDRLNDASAHEDPSEMEAMRDALSDYADQTDLLMRHLEALIHHDCGEGHCHCGHAHE